MRDQRPHHLGRMLRPVGHDVQHAIRQARRSEHIPQQPLRGGAKLDAFSTTELPHAKATTTARIATRNAA